MFTLQPLFIRYRGGIRTQRLGWRERGGIVSCMCVSPVLEQVFTTALLPVIGAFEVMASKYSKDFSIPENFPMLVKDFTREVLRVQPTNLVDFATAYFQDLHLKQQLGDGDAKHRSRVKSSAESTLKDT
eukprot:jgi/Botrbrau1/9975/Bobra.0012s0069.1